MTDDIVKQSFYDGYQEGLKCGEAKAADRIGTLEAALREIMEVSNQKSYGFAFDSHAVYFRMARAALAGEKKDDHRN